jgi:hypothetical protein
MSEFARFCFERSMWGTWLFYLSLTWTAVLLIAILYFLAR